MIDHSIATIRDPLTHQRVSDDCRSNHSEQPVNHKTGVPSVVEKATPFLEEHGTEKLKTHRGGGIVKPMYDIIYCINTYTLDSHKIVKAKRVENEDIYGLPKG